MPPPPRFPRFFQSPLLQPPLHKLFLPRPLPDRLPPTDLHLDGYRGPRVTSAAPYVDRLDELPDAPFHPTLSWDERRKENLNAVLEKSKKIIAEGLESWKPQENPGATAEAFKTLFVGRLPYDLAERQLKREFEVYGEIAEIKMVMDKTSGKFRGYAFVQFAKEEDMKAAFKDADAKKINGRRIVVDVERGRTVKTWRPKRLGGGLGRTRAGGSNVNQTYSGRDPKGSESLQKELGMDVGRRSHERERSLSPPGDRRGGSEHPRRRHDEQSYRHRR